MRILMVAMTHSVHTARWVAQFAEQGWDLHLFPSMDLGEAHREISNATIHHSFYADGKNPTCVRVRGFPVFEENVAYTARKVAEKLLPAYRVRQLARLIRRLRPDIVHSLELQHAGYLVSEAMELLPGDLPPWIVTCWGSDLYLFGRLEEHIPRIKKVLSQCDYLSSDCERDYPLATAYGFTGKFLPVIPGGGGFDLRRCREMRAPGPVSGRRIIMVKGYQGWSGRALVALRALMRCADLLHDYRIVVFSVHSEEMKIAVELMRMESGLKVETVPPGTPHDAMLVMQGQARLAIGLGISDGVPNSMLEAMVMGAFPIQSRSSGADEWVRDGVTGFLVPPDDPDVVEQAVRRALTDDALVESAADENWRVASQRLDHAEIKKKVIAFYQAVA